MKFWTVDSFTHQPFKGNPAGVCVVEKFPTVDLMQRIANEVNLSETAFIVHQHHEQYDLRWFTPMVEVELCGHATLAAAHVLWHELKVAHEGLHFNSLSGVLMASRAGHEMTLDFPAYAHIPITIPNDLAEILGSTPIGVYQAHDDWIIELAKFSDVVQLKPDIARLAQIDCRGIIVTAKGEKKDQYDFVSRFFAPRCGIDEDPVTGSAHCKLAPYWASRLGKNNMTAYQASQRGGVVKVRVDKNRVYLTGEAVTIIKGEIL